MYHLIFQVVLLLLNLMKGRCLFLYDILMKTIVRNTTSIILTIFQLRLWIEADVVETEIYGNKVYTVEKHNEVRVLMYKNMHQLYLRGSIPLEEAYKILESIK